MIVICGYLYAYIMESIDEEIKPMIESFIRNKSIFIKCDKNKGESIEFDIFRL